jgi:hypothetical protein
MLGFAVMEFPGIFFINRIDPIIFGMPFIYGFMLLIWLYMCIVLFAAYKMHWGKKSNKDYKEEGLKGMKGERQE